MPGAPALRSLEIAAAPTAWAALGFSVDGGTCRIGEVELGLRGGPGGIRGWTLAAEGGPDSLDGLPTGWTTAGAGAALAPSPHPNGATRLDHVVVLTDALARTLPALEGVGLGVRRVRDAGRGRRQAFLWLGERQLLLEVVEDPGAPDGRATFWGLTAVVDDLDAAVARFGDRLSAPREAVQAGRRITTVRPEAGLGAPVALISPHVRPS